MKNIILTITGIFIMLYATAQSNVVSLHVQTGDTVVLKIDDPQGPIQWQSSDDNSTWSDITGETLDTYKIYPPDNNYYRALVKGLECGDVYSEAIYVSSYSNAIDTLSKSELDLLIEHCYITMRAWYGKEVGCDFTEVGTDLYTWALDNRNPCVADYDEFFEGEGPSRNVALWNELYRGLLNCNAAVHFINKSSLSAPEKTQYEAEVRFLRAFYLWHIVETWGSSLYTTEYEPVEPGSFDSVAVDTVYAQIFQDLSFAEANLPETPDLNTILTKPVVEAFTVRMHLTRGNNAAALTYAQKLINNENYGLLDNYDTIWYIHNGQNSEVIYALDNTSYPDPLNVYADYIYEYDNERFYLVLREGGNQNHLLWEMQYEKFGWGMVRDMENGRAFKRYMPTKFFITLFNRELDQRFNGSFKTVWYCNWEASVPTWQEEYYIDGIKYEVDTALVGDPMFDLGDTAVLLTQESWPDDQKAKFDTNDLYYFHPTKGYVIVDIDDMYLPDGTPNYLSNRIRYIPITKKFMDSTRVDARQEYSSRNAYIIRLAEMYLIAAEAALQLGDTDSAYNCLLALANKRSYTGDGAGLLAAYGVNTGADIDIDFILDERARELAAEQLRWFDLKRTGKLIERVALHNTDAAPNIKEFHNVRPVPLDFEYLMYKYEGLVQNPGY